jgi:hypothetical protein
VDSGTRRCVVACVGGLAVPVSRDGYRALRRFARYWAHLRFAIDGQPGWVRH